MHKRLPNWTIYVVMAIFISLFLGAYLFNQFGLKSIEDRRAAEVTYAESSRLSARSTDPAYIIIDSINQDLANSQTLKENLSISMMQGRDGFFLTNLGTTKITDCKFGFNSGWATTMESISPGDSYISFSDLTGAKDNGLKNYQGVLIVERKTKQYSVAADCYADGRRKGSYVSFELPNI